MSTRSLWWLALLVLVMGMATAQSTVAGALTTLLTKFPKDVGVILVRADMKCFGSGQDKLWECVSLVTQGHQTQVAIAGKRLTSKQVVVKFGVP